MKATLRIGKGSATHNTHLFNAEHIDNERTEKNIYWTYKHGFTVADNLVKDETLFYKENYSEYLDRQNEKYRQRRQYKKVKTMEEYQKATPLNEMILQVGKKGETIEPELLEQITDKFIKQLKKEYGKNIHVVSYAMHNDEATPHIHLRLAFDYINKENIKQFGIDKALTQLGFKKPDASKKEDKWNNKKIAFTDKLRSIFYDLCDLYLFDKGKDLINRIVENPSHRHLKAELYKAQKQQEENAQLENENDGLITVNKQLLENIEKSKKELEQLKSENEKTRIDANRLTEYLNRCMLILVKAEELDIEKLGYSPLTKQMDGLRKDIGDMNKYGKNSNDSR